MTIPSNDKFYKWGYHNPVNSHKNPVLPLSSEQVETFQRIIQSTDGPLDIDPYLMPSGEATGSAYDQYEVKISNGPHISSPALFPHPNGTGEPIDRGNYYYSSGNFTVWPSPSGKDRYSAYWWDVSGIYFAPDIYGSGYSAYPTLPTGDAKSILLFDDLNQEKYWETGEIELNQDKKYLLWLNGRNLIQFGIFNYGRREFKTIKFPIKYSKRKKRYVYDSIENQPYYYSYFSSADHDIIDKGFEDFQIFYTYIHYIPELKGAKQLTHERVQKLNEIPFVSNARSVYLYSVYGAGKFRNLQAQNWSSVNHWDSVYSPRGVPSSFHNVLSAPLPPFPKANRGEEESKEQEYNTKEDLQKKFEAVSGLLGF